MIDPELVARLDEPTHRGEVQFGRSAPEELGLRLFLEDLNWLPARVQELAQSLTGCFELVPGHWVKLRLRGGRVAGYALNYELPPEAHYPISTLRVFLRRYGNCPEGLEQLLEPALNRGDTRWGLSLQVLPELVGKIFVRLPFELLPDVPEPVRRLASPWCYWSLPSPSGQPEVDVENVPLEALGLPLEGWPALPEPFVCPYAKYRGESWIAYLGWPAWSAWWRPPFSRAAQDHEGHASRVRAYYDSQQEAYLEHLGPIWQAGTWSAAEVAQHARLGPGLRVLDAGCGVGGPARELLELIPGLCLEGVTLCAAQVEEARRRGVAVRQADFHHLPFADKAFDRVLYLESSGHAFDRVQVFREAGRVLEVGGLVYVKDIFRRPGPLSDGEWLDLASFEQLYAYRTPTLEDTLEALRAAGFTNLESEVLSLSMERFHQAMGPAGQPTSFGRAHGRDFRHLPLFFAHLRAVRG